MPRRLGFLVEHSNIWSSESHRWVSAEDQAEKGERMRTFREQACVLAIQDGVTFLRRAPTVDF
jgi:hypothetical protein